MLGGLTGDEIVGVIAILMALTVVIGTTFRRGLGNLRAAWPALLWMALVWGGIIAAAALAFRHFRPGEM